MNLFLENLISASTQVGMLYVMVAAGFICDKTGLFSEETAKKVVRLLLYFITPCTLVNAFSNIENTPENVKKFAVSFLIATATHVIAILVNAPFYRNKDSETGCIYKFASIYGNVSFMALPLAQAILGDEGTFYCANGVLVFNVVNFAHGAILMGRGDEKKINLKNLLMNPGVVSFVIGLPIFLLGIKLPYIVSEPLRMMAGLNSPIAMLIFGTYLAHTDLKSMFTDKNIYRTAFMKLLVVPLLCLSIYYLCGVTGVLLTASIITASAPSANNTFMLATRYERDTSVASKTVALVSFISVLTIPVMIALTQLTW